MNYVSGTISVPIPLLVGVAFQPDRFPIHRQSHFEAECHVRVGSTTVPFWVESIPAFPTTLTCGVSPLLTKRLQTSF